MGRLPHSIVPFLFLLAACRSFEVQRERVFLRYQPAEDVLDAVLVYEGVGATKGESVESTVETLSSMARGRRLFMLFDWFLEYDIDELLHDMQSKPIDHEDEHAGSMRRFLEYESSISVDEARFLLDGTEKDEDDEPASLCLLQRLRFGRASQLLRCIDSYLNETMREVAGKEEGEIFGDPATDRLVVARATAGGSWTRFDGATLEVSVPMTSTQAASLLKELMATAGSSPEDFQSLAQFLEPLSSLQVTGDELRLRFAPAEDGWILFTFDDERRGYRPDVANRLREDGLVVSGGLEAEVQRLKAKP